MKAKCATLSIRAKRKLGLPPGGLWYYTRDPMLQEMGDSLTALPVGWKKPNNKFVFGLFPTREEAYESIFSLESGKRQAYEVVVLDKQCHLYFDLEWEGARDETHEKIKAFVRKVVACCLQVISSPPPREQFLCRSCSHKHTYILRGSTTKCKIHRHVFACQVYEKSVRPIVLCDTRKIPESEMWKNSYHVHVQEIVYRNNYEGGIKIFVRGVLEELSGPEWFWTSKKGTRMHMVDACVYRKNGLFRLAGCGKNNSCLQELDLETGRLDPVIKLEAWLKCLVCTTDQSNVPTVSNVRDATRLRVSVAMPASDSVPLRCAGGSKRPKAAG